MSDSGLNTLQRRLLAEISQRSNAFFMTGGGVLVEWVLRHRRTDDLDMFTTNPEAMSSCDAILRASAEAISAQVEAITTTPDFRRYLVRADDEATRVDFVHDRAPQLFPKLKRDGILTDSEEEIFVNKVCCLVERSELRDLLDLMLLEERGMRVEDYLEKAQQKDGGVSAATLAWLLSQLKIPDKLEGAIGTEQLRRFARDLETRMLILARPSNDDDKRE
jgi:hypothetical protein